MDSGTINVKKKIKLVEDKFQFGLVEFEVLLADGLPTQKPFLLL